MKCLGLTLQVAKQHTAIRSLPHKWGAISLTGQCEKPKSP